MGLKDSSNLKKEQSAQITSRDGHRVVSFQKWMLENEEFLDALGKHAARRIADCMLERGEVDWEEIIDGLSADMEREMDWFAPRNFA